MVALMETQRQLMDHTHQLAAQNIQHNNSFGPNQSLLSDNQFTALNQQLTAIASGSNYETIRGIVPYDGKNKEEFLDWLTNLEDTCANFALEPLKTAFLRSSGPVKQIIAKYRSTDKWPKIRRRLIEQFSPYPTVHHVTAALKEIRQGSEGLESYVNRYQRLYQLADYRSLYDVVAPTEISGFITSLRNAKLASQVEKSNPTSLADAMNKALEKSNPMMRDEAVRLFSRVGTTSAQPKTKKVLAVSRHPIDEEYDSDERVEMMTMDDGTQRPRHEVVAISQGMKARDSTCHRCGKEGHWSWDCDKPRDYNRPNAPPTQGRLNTTLTASTPVTEGLYDFLKDIFAINAKTAQRARNRKDHYKAAYQAQQGATNQTPSNDTNKPPYRKPQAPPQNTNYPPKPLRGGAKKFDLVPPKTNPKKDDQKKDGQKGHVNAVTFTIQEETEDEGAQMESLATTQQINSITSALVSDSEDDATDLEN